ncbi:MAG TPA: hypothetical protein VER09_01165 [Pseudomonas sp.]|nr:hypothetical protein [Pseudomonas sp.]
MAGLSARHLQAIHTLLRNRGDTVPLNATWQQIQRVLEVGEPRGKTLYFDADMLRVLRTEASRAAGSDLLANVPGGDRLHTARSGFIDEKLAPQRPDAGYVLVKGALPAPLPQLAPELSLRVPLSSLELTAIEQVLVIENLDCFDNCHQYRLPEAAGRSLVVYRGHDAQAKGMLQLLSSLPPTTPIVCFPDYDPAGLGIALALPRCDALLVPELTPALLAKGSRDDFLEQYRSIRHLEGRELDGWQAVWEEMLGQQLSIKQQHMLALEAPLRLLPRRS